MRTPGNLETHCTGAAHAKVFAVGRLIRTRPGRIISKTVVGATATSPAANPRCVVFDGQEFVIVESFAASYHCSDGVSWAAGGSLTGGGGGAGQGAGTDGAGTIIAPNNVSGTASLQKTVNHGVSWTATGATPASTAYGPIGYGNGRWIAIRAVTVFTESIYSDDQGATWTAHGTLPSAGAAWSKISCIGGIWYASCDFWSNMAISRDNGATWIAYPLFGNASGMHAYNSKLGRFTISASGGVYEPVSSVDGKYWYSAMPGQLAGGACVAVADVFLLNFQSGGNGVYVSDGARNWWNIDNWGSWIATYAASGNGVHVVCGPANPVVKFTDIESVYEAVTE